MNNEKFELNKNYNYDVKFADNTVGQLLLSPKGIILKMINQTQSPVFKNDYIDIITCKTVVEGIKITLLELTPLNMNGHIDVATETLYSNNIYLCKSAILGEHFDNIDNISVSNISIVQNSIRQWIRLRQVEFKINNTSVLYKIPFNKQILQYSLNNFEFTLSFESNFSVSKYNDTFPKTEYCVNFQLKKLNSFGNMLEYLEKWQMLYSIFMGQIEPPQAIRFQVNNLNNLAYYYPIGLNNVPKLHYIQVPVPYSYLCQNFKTILDEWFNMGDDDRQNITYLHDATDETKDIKHRFLAVYKLIEGITKGDKCLFFEEKDLINIKNNIKNFVKKEHIEIDDIEDFLRKLDFTNEHKLDTKDYINNLITQNDEYKFLHLDKQLIEKLNIYRNTLSHNNNFSKHERINYNEINEGCLKYIVLGYLYFWRKYGIQYNYLSITLLKWTQILKGKSKLQNEIIIELPELLLNNEKIKKLQEQYKILNIRFIDSNPENIQNGYDSIILINLTNNKLEKNIPNFIQKFLKILGKTEYKRGFYYLDGLNRIIAELPDTNTMQSQEISSSLKKLFAIIEQESGTIDPSQLIVYDKDKEKWDYKTSIEMNKNVENKNQVEDFNE